ncbi:hypothetical protein J2X76_006013 [Neorhizobium sp. 2083]|nr:hypothetical protein [Neorhizobium sp. 2083]
MNKSAVHGDRGGLSGDRNSKVGTFYYSREERRLDSRVGLVAFFDFQIEHADLLDDLGFGFGRSGCKNAG